MPEKKYGKPARPFELWNIGNYETFTGSKERMNTLPLCLNFIRRSH